MGVKEWLWTATGKDFCLFHAADNNLAERSLRLAVTKRKVSGGSRSMSRFEQTADLLSVIQTCRFQCRRAMVFFRDALSAHYRGFLMPSLIPQTIQT